MLIKKRMLVVRPHRSIQGRLTQACAGTANYVTQFSFTEQGIKTSKHSTTH